MSSGHRIARQERDLDRLMTGIVSSLTGIDGGAVTHKCAESDWEGLPARALFMAATKEEDMDKFTRLLQDPDWKQHVNDLDGDDFGILHLRATNSRCTSNSRAIVKAVAEAGGDINLRIPKSDETPLQLAVMYKNLVMAEALLEHGARVELADYRGYSPIITARKQCEHKGAGDEECCKIFNLVLKAEEERKNNTELQRSAENLRQKGNVAFGKQQYQKAIDAYTKSLDCLADYRTYSNRSACYLKLANQNLQEHGRVRNEQLDWANDAKSDAITAIELKPDFVKAHYRHVVAFLFERDFPRAKLHVEESLKKCPDSAALQSILRKLEEYKTSDVISNPFSSHVKEMRALVESGKCYWDRCPFCWSQVPHDCFDTEQHKCPFCIMDLHAQVANDEIVDFLLKL